MPRVIWQAAPLLRQGKSLGDLEHDLLSPAPDEEQPALIGQLAPTAAPPTFALERAGSKAHGDHIWAAATAAPCRVP